MPVKTAPLPDMAYDWLLLVFSLIVALSLRAKLVVPVKTVTIEPTGKPVSPASDPK